MIDANSKTGKLIAALAREAPVTRRYVCGEDVRVIQGQIPVESITIAVSTGNVLVLEVDTRSKYAGHCSIGGPVDGPHAVHLSAGERTLAAEPGDKETVIRLPAGTAGWTVMVDWRRYTVRIVAYKPEMDVVIYEAERADGG